MQICYFGSRSLILINIFKISMFSLFWVPFYRNMAHCNLETKSTQVFNFRSRSSISNIVLMIHELDLLWLSNFIALRIYFIFRAKSSWNEVIDTCWIMSNECYLTVILIFFVVTWWSLVVTVRYRSLLLVPTFSMNVIFDNILTSVSKFKKFSTILNEQEMICVTSLW